MDIDGKVVGGYADRYISRSAEEQIVNCCAMHIRSCSILSWSWRSPVTDPHQRPLSTKHILTKEAVLSSLWEQRRHPPEAEAQVRWGWCYRYNE